ncbi:MAG TPA: DUF2281 domain-containing protein [Gemmatimonadaceae bacterium]|nr:DUF2281 domain-containing protein [Gemmatimonadaceae bacterium]
MNAVLRDRIVRKLDTLPDERVYAVLDFIEFLESKYAARQAASPNVFQRFAEGMEDTMRAGRVSAATIGETMNYLSKAMGVLSGAVAAGKSVATDVLDAATRPAPRPPEGSPPAPMESDAPSTSTGESSQ